MSRPVKLALCLCVLLCAGAAAEAQTINWNYVEAGLTGIDPSGRSSENGVFVAGSGQFIKILHAFGEFGDLGPINQWQVGVGWHGLFGKRADLFADGAYYDVDFDSGAKIRFGARWMILKRIEINGNFAWTNLRRTNESFAANAIWDFSKRFSLGGGFEWGDELSAARVFVRFNFGQRGS